MSASLLQSPELRWTEELEVVRPALNPQQGERWNPEAFAHEQIRGLVRRVFFGNPTQPFRQVVFSAIEPETDVRSICRRVGYALALETAATVAVMGGCPHLMDGVETQPEQMAEQSARQESLPPLQRIATKVGRNLWLVPAAVREGSQITAGSLHSYLAEIRREFEYSIVEGLPAGGANETMAMAQFADGIVLVLSAQRTRPAAARKVKEGLEAAQARLLGTVLSDRMFPIPEGIYRRL